MTDVTLSNQVIAVTVGDVQGPAGPQGNAGPIGPSGNATTVNTVADFQAATFPAVVQSATILGYYSIGLGGFTVRRVNSEPAHPFKQRSADRFLPSGSTDGANGGWWEGYSNTNIIMPEQFGAHADDINDDLPAINNAILYAQMQLYVSGNTLPCIYFPSKRYYCSDTIVIGILANLNSRTAVELRGRVLHQAQGTATIPTTIRFPVDKTAIKVTEYSYAGTKISGINFQGVNGDGNSAYGIWLRAPTKVQSCIFANFSTHGVFLDSDGSDNVDSCEFDDVRILTPGRDGIRAQGSDAQIGTFSNILIQGAGGCAIYDASYYGNLYQNICVNGNGQASMQTRTGLYGAWVKGSDNKIYMVAPGAEASTATTDPATTVNDAVWIKTNLTPGSQPTYVPGRTYNFGPVIYVGGNTSVFNYVYIETGFSPPAFNGGGALFMNCMADTVSTSATGISKISAEDGGVRLEGGIHIWSQTPPRLTYGGNVLEGYLGGVTSDGQSATFMRWKDSNFTAGYTGQFNHVSGVITYSYAGNGVYDIITPLSAKTYGGGSAVTVQQPAFYNGLMLMDRNGSGNQVFSAQSAPTTVGARNGDFALNNGIAANRRYSPLGWRYFYDDVAAAFYQQPVKATEVTIYAPMTVANLATLTATGNVSEGDRGSVTDATQTFAAVNIGTAPTGGGGNKIPVVYLNGAWVIG